MNKQLPTDAGAEAASGKHIGSPLQRALLALIYSLCMWFSYRELSAYWSYMGFTYGPPSGAIVFFAILGASAPAMLLPERVDSFSKFAAWLLFFTLFLPATIIPILQGWSALPRAVSLYVVELASIVAFLLLVKIKVRGLRLPRTRPFPFWMAITAVYVLLHGYIIYTFGSGLALVGFEDVYEQRFSIQFGVSNSIVLYVITNLSYGLNPFLIATGIADRRPFRVAAGIVGQILIYSALAGKIVLASIFIIALSALLFTRRGEARPLRIAMGMAGVGLIGIVLNAYYSSLGTSLANFVDLLYLRTLYLPGVAVGGYFDFFSNYPATYLSHSTIGRFFVAYPYGNLSIGEVVGSYMIPGSIINFNANFIASDGIAGFGLAGIPAIIIFVWLVLAAIDKVLGRTALQARCMALMPFVMLLADGSAFTALLTGGGVLSAALIWCWGGLGSNPSVSASGSSPPLRLDNRPA